MRCVDPAFKRKPLRQWRRFEPHASLYGLLGGGLAAALVHATGTHHMLTTGALILAGFLAGVAFDRANGMTSSNAAPSSRHGHSVADDIHVLEKRGPRWFVVAMVLLCVATDLSGALSSNASGLLWGIGTIHRLIDAASGWQAPNTCTTARTPPHPASIGPARPELIRL